MTDDPANDRVNCRNGFNLASTTSSSNAVTLLGSSVIGVSWVVVDPAAAVGLGAASGLGVVGDGALWAVTLGPSRVLSTFGVLWACSAKSSIRVVAASSLQKQRVQSAPVITRE